MTRAQADKFAVRQRESPFAVQSASAKRSFETGSGPAPVPRRSDQIIECSLAFLLIFMPLAFGAVEAWSECVVTGAVAVIACCLAVQSFSKSNQNQGATWLVIPVVLFVLLVVLQLLPLPAGVVQAIAPQTSQIKTRYLADLPQVEKLLHFMTLSFYPLATSKTLRIVLCASVVFLAVINVYQSHERIKRLLTIITGVGAAIALLALAQDFSHATGVYWSLSTDASYRATAGSFINYNNFSQFMNLSIGAGIALAMSILASAGAFRGTPLPRVLKSLTKSDAWIVRGVAVFIVIGAFAIFLSGSRGGMISLLLAFTLTGLSLATRRRSRDAALLLSAVGVIGFAVVLYFGFDTAYRRLGSLSSLQKASPMRWEANKDVWKMWRQFPLLGVGLGNHEVVYPMFSQTPLPGLSEQLENDYLQLIEETGLLGFASAILFLAGIAICYVRIVRKGTRSIHTAAYGLGFGLIAILVHSSTDFGQRLPANACITAVFCGLLVLLARSTGDVASGSPQRASGLALRPIFASVAVVAAMLWAFAGSARSALAASAWNAALPIAKDLAAQGWQGDNETYTRLLHYTADAASIQPDNIEYAFWLSNYRWYSVSRLRDDAGKIVITDQTEAHTKKIVADMNQARALCPTFGPLYCAVGQLELFVLQDAVGAKHIREGFQLAPSHPLTCFAAGRLDASDGHWEASLTELTRAVALGHPLSEVMDVFVRDVDRPELALQLAQGNRGQLDYIADMLKKSGKHPDVEARAREQARQILRMEAEQPSATPQDLASRAADYYLEHNDTAAADYYRRALAQEYANVAWHFGLAQALARSGQTEQAIHEARICLRMRADMSEAKKLIEDLSVAARKAPLQQN